MKHSPRQNSFRSLCAHLAALLLGVALAAPTHAAGTRTQTDLSGSGWKLWHDKDAPWQHDPLFLPPVDLSKLPTNPPIGGWEALDAAANGAVAAEVPGTVEEYLQKAPSPEGDLQGVSWWWRTVRVPADAAGRKVLLRFDSVRLRAEIYLNHKLVGYDTVGNTPFEVDLTGAAKPGEDCQLAVRVTDPGGNYDWRDSSPFQWGDYTIPMSHAFGGITGRVSMVVCDPIYIDDIYVQNTPEITKANCKVVILNTTGAEVRRKVSVNVSERSPSPAAMSIITAALDDALLPPGRTSLEIPINAPDAKRWELNDPRLYTCLVQLTDSANDKAADADTRAFGFRWFAPEGIGQDAVFRLNGKRIVLRTAISWGFWPITGIYPKPEWAEKEIRTAKEMGQNMLNFHRGIGHPVSFEKADELGLLIYEEPGGYVSGDGTPFSKELSRLKLLRMVRRDRSHPSLVIYNMINEAWDSRGAGKDKAVLNGHIRDLRDAHALDPSRTITHTSAWAREPEGPAKMHMRPYDTELYTVGWYDFHHAGGPEVWRQDLYTNPGKYYNRTEDKEEIVYWGEEGAISTPPRLDKIKTALANEPRMGWDGNTYLEWQRTFEDFIARKNLRAAFPTVESLTTAFGNVSLGHQAHKIETMRLNNVTDGYAVNGWEAETLEDHSGIVDGFRNPKGDPAIMARRNRPLYVAVKPRSQFAQIPGETAVDFYAINEKDLRGAHTLRVSAKNPSGQEVFAKEIPVTLAGGETYGQLIAENVAIPITGAVGMFRVEAALLDAAGKPAAEGSEDVLAVDWKSAKLGGQGAVWEPRSRVRDFLREQKNLDAPTYRDDLPKLDWVIAARPPGEGETVAIPADRLRDASEQHSGLGLTAEFFGDTAFRASLHKRLDPGVNLSIEDGATPDPAVPMTDHYSVRWTGQLLPTATGDYTFLLRCNGGARVTINGQPIIDVLKNSDTQTLRGQIKLEGDKAAPLVVEYQQPKLGGRCILQWAPPEQNAPDAQRLIDRVKNDGTTLLVLDRADTWMDLIGKNAPIKYGGSFKIGTAWLGGLHFVREHPLFKGLPVNCAMDWPYQLVVRDGRNRSGLALEGEELVAGAWHSFPMQLGTAVGVIPCGKGRIVVSTLELCEGLSSRDTSAEVTRKLLCNFIEFGSNQNVPGAL